MRLDDRQGVHVGADQDGRSLAVLEDADDAVAADLLGHLEAEVFQLLGQAGRRFLLLVGQLRVGVELLVECLQIGQFAVDVPLDVIDFGPRLGQCGPIVLGIGGRSGTRQPARNRAELRLVTPRGQASVHDRTPQ